MHKPLERTPLSTIVGAQAGVHLPQVSQILDMVWSWNFYLRHHLLSNDD